MRHLLLITVILLATLPTAAQYRMQSGSSKYMPASRDYSGYEGQDQYTSWGQSKPSRHEGVITNPLSMNWYVFGGAGVHMTIDNDMWIGPLKGCLASGWHFGIGKWFAPSIALRLELMKTTTKGYTQRLEGGYGVGPVKHTADDIPYRDKRIRWVDFNAGVQLNLTRMVKGYEGIGSNAGMNQFLVGAGLGIMYPLGIKGSDMSIDIHFDLQYSRYLTHDKRYSLDLKLKSILYENGNDLDYGVQKHKSYPCRANVGLNIGLTYYLGKMRPDGWEKASAQSPRRDYRKMQTSESSGTHSNALADIKQNQSLRAVTFYVFFPKSNSGWDDNPIYSQSAVSAIDKLVSGLYARDGNDYVWEDDDATNKQLSVLNSRIGTNIISKDFDNPDGDYVVSFTDVYAALEEDHPFLDSYTDTATVDKLRLMLSHGIVTVIEAHGIEKSKDRENSTLTNCQIRTILGWLKENKHLSTAKTIIYNDNNFYRSGYASNHNMKSMSDNCIKVRLQIIY